MGLTLGESRLDTEDDEDVLFVVAVFVLAAGVSAETPVSLGVVGGTEVAAEVAAEVEAGVPATVGLPDVVAAAGV